MPPDRFGCHGQYKEYLPGERRLSTYLGVSRTVIQEALKIIQNYGLIEIAHGKRTRIVPRKVYAQTAPPKLVCMLAKGSMHELSRSAALVLVKLHEILHEAGYTLRTFHLGPTDIGPSIRRIRQLVQENPASCWVVRSGNASIQKFFDGCGIPTFLIAYAGEGISLPYTCGKDAHACLDAVDKLLAVSAGFKVA